MSFHILNKTKAFKGFNSVSMLPTAFFFATWCRAQCNFFISSFGAGNKSEKIVGYFLLCVQITKFIIYTMYIFLNNMYTKLLLF